MYLEERIDELEKLTEQLANEITKLKQRNTGEILTPKEFAHKTKLNENTVYCWIREGKIKVIPNLGTALRIPMSQFYDMENPVTEKLSKSEELRRDFQKRVKERRV